MAFRPRCHRTRSRWTGVCSSTNQCGLMSSCSTAPLNERFTLDAEAGVLYIDLDGYRVRTRREIEDVREAVASRVGPLGRRVAASSVMTPARLIQRSPKPGSPWRRMSSGGSTPCSRYTTSAFMRLKLGDALARRGSRAPHLRDPQRDARPPVASRAEPDLMARSTDSRRVWDGGGPCKGGPRHSSSNSGRFLGLSNSGFHETAYVEWLGGRGASCSVSMA